MPPVRTNSIKPMIVGAAALALSSNAFAQDYGEADDVDGTENEIVVLGYDSRGAIVGEAAVELELNEADIASYGASNIQELISQLAPLTRSSRGEGGGAPVLLLNGRRISDRREIFHIPPEAIERVQVLPEEVALRYGYSADQRVINFILKKNFDAVTAEAEYGASTAGGRGEGQLEANYLKLTEGGRVSLEAEYNHATPLLERDRNIRYATGASDEGRFRTLLPETDELQLNALISRSLNDTTGLTLNATHERSDSVAWLGLDGASGLRTEQDAQSRTTHLGATLDGVTAGWQWTMTANADWQRDHTELGLRGGGVRDTGLARQRTLDADINTNGSLIALPAGDALLGLRLGIADTALTSERTRSGVMSAQNLGRTDTTARANLDVPIIEGGRGALGALGDVSANINGAMRHFSDFGTVYSYGYGGTWKPSRNLSVIFSLVHEKDAPTVQQLGAPLITTPNVTVYDFVRGQTVLVDAITGGDPTLNPENRTDWKISTSWEAPFAQGLTLLLDYYDNNNRGRLANFPLLTPEIEAALPERVVRDASGALVSIDRRSINLAQSNNQVLRYGFSYSKSFGASDSGGRGPRSGGSGRRMRGDGGRWNVDLFHSVRLQDEILVRPGLKLDLLDGGALDGDGGPGRHLVELDGGWSFKGVGIRASAKYQSSSRVDGGLTGSDLAFSDLFTLDLRAFINFDSNAQLVNRHPWLDGLRLRLKAENITNSTRTVRDSTGAVPLSYQPGYLDPRGRFFEISLRKQF